MRNHIGSHRGNNYRRTRGHRQEQTVLRIVDVSPTGTRPKAGAKAKAAPKTDTKPKAETKEKAAPPAETKKTEDRAPGKEEAKKKPAAKKATARKTAAKKTTVRKPANKKPAAKKTSGDAA